MIELYCGDGKGKTTAAAGMAVRAAGNGIPVVFFQFMKDGSSGEMKILKQLPEVTVYYPETFYGFSNAMNGQQKEEMKIQYAKFLEMAACLIEKQHSVQRQENIRKIQNGEWVEQVRRQPGHMAEVRSMIILDEIIHACNKELVSEENLLKLLEECPDNTEIILTGRNPSERLWEKADYISEIENQRHPFDRGIKARKGIER